MNIKIVSNGHTKQADLLKRSIDERIPATWDADGMTLILDINSDLGPIESYIIEGEKNEWKITGTDGLGLFYGIGKLLHSAKWTAEVFEPVATDGLVSPACSFRATYYTVHFHNWYHEAPVEELVRYTEEVLLYGYNAIFCILPVINLNNFEEDAFYMFRDKTRTIYKIAKDLGMKVGTIINANQGLKTTPDKFLADPSCYKDRTGNNGKNICPEIDGALDYLRSLWVKILEQYTDIGLDYVMTWPYDEGGCGCPKCYPWGGNGFPKASNEVHKEVIKLYPDAKFILATWYFDEVYVEPRPIGEYEGLYEHLRTDMSYVDYIMVDSHNMYPRYPLEHDIVKPIINFPEISMYGLKSWGGRGAMPLPKRFQRIWDSSKRVLDGGMPYSEGMYEDVSKVQFAGYYWDPDKNYREILGEYIAYEFSDKVVDEVLEIMELIEKNHVLVREGNEPDWDAALRAEKLAEEVNAKLCPRAKTAWRWRLMYIRARIDRMVYEYHRENCQGKENALSDLWQTKEEYLADNDEAQELLQELCRLYHTIDKEYKKNHWTFPPVKGGKVLKNR